MAKRKKNKNQSQSEVTNNANDTEFATEFTQSKKARKRAAREERKNK
jgi:hypothetical protein